MEDRNTYKIYENGKLGEVRIANDVIAIIAGLAATETEGVSALAGNMTNEIISKLGMKNLSKGIKVVINDNIAEIEVSIVLDYGYNIIEVSSLVQEKVKSAIENMTGMEVVKVNVKIANVNIENN